VTDNQTITDSRLLGTWKSPNVNDTDAFAIELKDSVYNIEFSNGKDKDSAHFEGRLARVGDAEIMDLICTDDNPFGARVHMLARIWIAGDSAMQWTFLDSDWIRQQARQALATQESDDRTLITTQGNALAQFLRNYGADDRAHGDNNDLVKVK